MYNRENVSWRDLVVNLSLLKYADTYKYQGRLGVYENMLSNRN